MRPMINARVRTLGANSPAGQNAELWGAIIGAGVGIGIGMLGKSENRALTVLMATATSSALGGVIGNLIGSAASPAAGSTPVSSTPPGGLPVLDGQTTVTLQSNNGAQSATVPTGQTITIAAPAGGTIASYSAVSGFAKGGNTVTVNGPSFTMGPFNAAGSTITINVVWSQGSITMQTRVTITAQ